MCIERYRLALSCWLTLVRFFFIQISSFWHLFATPCCLRRGGYPVVTTFTVGTFIRIQNILFVALLDDHRHGVHTLLYITSAQNGSSPDNDSGYPPSSDIETSPICSSIHPTARSFVAGDIDDYVFLFDLAEHFMIVVLAYIYKRLIGNSYVLLSQLNFLVCYWSKVAK